MKVAIGYFDEDSTVTSYVFGYELNGYYSDVTEIDVDTIDEAVEIAREKYDMTWGIIITENLDAYRFGFNPSRARYEYEPFD